MLTYDQALTTVKSYIAAFNARDFDTIEMLFGEDASLEDPVGSTPVHSREAIRCFYNQFLETDSWLRLIEPIRVAGSSIVFSFVALIDSNGVPTAVDVTDVWDLNEQNLIARMRAYFGEANMRPLDGEGAVNMKYEALPMIGRVALVIGGGSGIGQATAFEFARQGASVVVSGRRLSACEETVGMIHEAGGRALALTVDAAEEAQVSAVVEATLKTFGRLDFAVNTAGLTHDPTFLIDLTLEQYEATMAVNARSIFLGMKYQIRAMISSGVKGAIVNVTSDAAIGGLPMLCDYSGSKHAATGLSRTAALEYARDGIRINSLAPGPIKTPMLDSQAGTEEALQALMAPGRIGKPEEVADAAVWLCSDRASFVYGQVLQVDGALGGVSAVAPVTLPERTW